MIPRRGRRRPAERPLSPVAGLLNYVVAAALAVLVISTAVGWMMHEITGDIPQPLIGAAVYSIAAAEIGTRLLARLQRLKLI